MYKMDLALNNLQRLIRHKTQKNKNQSMMWNGQIDRIFYKIQYGEKSFNDS